MQTVYDYISRMSVDKLAEYLAGWEWVDYAPWDKWFTKKYCDNCSTVVVPWSEFWERIPNEYDKGRMVECSYCEYNKCCKFFPDNSPYGTPEEVDIIKAYLNSEIEDKTILCSEIEEEDK